MSLHADQDFVYLKQYNVMVLTTVAICMMNQSCAVSTYTVMSYTLHFLITILTF